MTEREQRHDPREAFLSQRLARDTQKRGILYVNLVRACFDYRATPLSKRDPSVLDTLKERAAVEGFSAEEYVKLTRYAGALWRAWVNSSSTTRGYTWRASSPRRE